MKLIKSGDGMPTVTVDGKQVEVQNGMTVMQACELAGASIPRFCYHERLDISGNCRMCLVKLDKVPKPVASCAQPVADGMVIYTNTEEVQNMRKGVMEFLLINHPLDCPICDQAGECDLQENAMLYGMDHSEFREPKRSVADKYMGPLVHTNMTRCIHCIRCVRFMDTVAGTNELGAFSRGGDMYIATYTDKPITSELSGNIIDLCPVGALTAKPARFQYRPWELTHTYSIDVLDAVGSNIMIDAKGNHIIRILPRIHEEINEEWLSDKGRFACDALSYQRLDAPMIKGQSGKLESTDWQSAYKEIQKVISKVSGESIGAIAGDLVDVESMLVMKEFLNALGSNNYDCRQDGALLSNAVRGDYIFNTTIARAKEADFCLIIGSNPRVEAPLLCSKIRQGQQEHGMHIALIGESADLAMKVKHLGDNPWLLKQIADGQHPICSKLSSYKKPMLIIGSGAMAREDYMATLYNAKRIAQKYNFVQEDWNGFNVLQRVASRVGGMDVGFLPTAKGMGTKDIAKNASVIFLMQADEVEYINPSAFVVYIGHHGDKLASRANVILPVAAYSEKIGTYVNLEGRVQRTAAATAKLGLAKDEWKAIIDLAVACDIKLLYNSLSDIHDKMASTNPIFATLDTIVKSDYKLEPGKQFSFSDDKFVNPINNYYQTDAISRNSKTMAKCATELCAKL